MRAIISIVAAMALVAILAGGACAACWAPIQKASHCCNPAGHCTKPGKTPVHPECASRPVDLGSVEQVATHVVLIVEPVAEPAPAEIMRTVSYNESPPLDKDPYSPLDLCVLNSVLTI
jgi:hypothetical protein